MVQLRIAEGATSEEHSAEHTADPPRNDAGKLVPQDSPVDWAFALWCAALAAGVAGLLQALSVKLPAMSAAQTMWVLVAPAVVIVLYQRGRPKTAMQARVGARLGAMTGVLLASIVVFVVAMSGFLMRYHYHSMAADAELTAVLEQAIDHARTQGSVTPAMEAVWKSAEFRAWFLTLETVMMSLLTIGFSAAAGAAVGALLAPKQRGSV